MLSHTHGLNSLFSFFFFFFSSRRRHTRLQGDWSSDVCSSDLVRSQLVRDCEHPLTVQPLIAVSVTLRPRATSSGASAARFSPSVASTVNTSASLFARK